MQHLYAGRQGDLRHMNGLFLALHDAQSFIGVYLSHAQDCSHLCCVSKRHPTIHTLWFQSYNTMRVAKHVESVQLGREVVPSL